MRKKYCFLASQQIDAERREEKAKARRTMKAIERSKQNAAARRRLAELYDIRFVEFKEITGFSFTPFNLMKKILDGDEKTLAMLEEYFDKRVDRVEEIPLDLPELPRR